MNGERKRAVRRGTRPLREDGYKCEDGYESHSPALTEPATARGRPRRREATLVCVAGSERGGWERAVGRGR